MYKTVVIIHKLLSDFSGSCKSPPCVLKRTFCPESCISVVFALGFRVGTGFTNGYIRSSVSELNAKHLEQNVSTGAKLTQLEKVPFNECTGQELAFVRITGNDWFQRRFSKSS